MISETQTFWKKLRLSDKVTIGPVWNGHFGTISVMERRCAAPIVKVERRISDRFLLLLWKGLLVRLLFSPFVYLFTTVTCPGVLVCDSLFLVVFSNYYNLQSVYFELICFCFCFCFLRVLYSTGTVQYSDFPLFSKTNIFQIPVRPEIR